MSEREPLLSDERLTQIGCGILDLDDVKRDRRLQHLYNARRLGAFRARDHYERLIDEGKMRVVEEVENIGGPPRFAYVCSHCDHAHSADFRWNFCPGCGNKIKR